MTRNRKYGPKNSQEATLLGGKHGYWAIIGGVLKYETIELKRLFLINHVSCLINPVSINLRLSLKIDV